MQLSGIRVFRASLNPLLQRQNHNLPMLLCRSILEQLIELTVRDLRPWLQHVATSWLRTLIATALVPKGRHVVTTGVNPWLGRSKRTRTPKG